MAHYVIYIPGLGDSMSYGQRMAVQVWRMYGVRPCYMALGWATPEGIEAKLARIQRKVNELIDAGHTVSLVGVSAGASAVLNAYAADTRIRRVVCISGKINHPETVGKPIFDKNPDFRGSLQRLEGSIELLRSKQLLENVMSAHPKKDETVPVADTIIAGAHEKQFPGRSHPTGIFYAITYGGPAIARFLKGQ